MHAFAPHSFAIRIALALGTAFFGPHAAAYAAGPAAASSALRDTTIAICNDENEWPPYTYYERVAGRKTDKLIGYTISVIDAIFSRHQLRYRVSLVPWARCQAEVKNGVRFQMAIDMSANAERRETYLLTRTYYAVSPHYFYSRRAHPQGLPLDGPLDLTRYTLCGLQGHTYTAYGLNTNQVDQGARTYAAVLQKLHVGRCDIFLNVYEVMLGFGMMGTPVLDDPDLAHALVPQLPQLLYYIGISRRFAHAAELKAIIDQEIEHMDGSGELKAIWKKSVRE